MPTRIRRPTHPHLTFIVDLRTGSVRSRSWTSPTRRARRGHRTVRGWTGPQLSLVAERQAGDRARRPAPDGIVQIARSSFPHLAERRTRAGAARCVLWVADCAPHSHTPPA